MTDESRSRGQVSTTQQPRPLRAIIYARKSRNPRKQSRSVEDQIAAGRQDCEREGWAVARVFIDDDRPGSRYTTKKRDDFEELIRYIEQGHADVLIAWESSRLQRDLEAYLRLRNLCAKSGVLWRYQGRTYDLTRAEDRFATGLDALTAERYSDEAHRNLVRAVRAREERGRYHGGSVVFGYRAEGDELPIHNWETGETRIVLRNVRLVVVPEHAEEIRAAVRRILTGGSLFGVVRDWLAKEIKGPRGGTGWTSTKVRDVLLSPTLAGYRRTADGRLMKADWDGIIDLETHKRLVSILGHSKGTRFARRHLLSSIASCAHCTTEDRVMWLQGHVQRRQSYKNFDAYRCAMTKYPPGCGLEVRSVYIDSPVVDLVLDALSSPEFRQRLETSARTGQDTSRLEALIAEDRELDQRLQELNDALGVKIGPDAYAQGEWNIQQRKREIAQELEQHRDTHAGLLASLPTEKEALAQSWGKWDLDERRAIIKLCLERVEVTRPGKGRRINPLTHLNPVWRV